MLARGASCRTRNWRCARCDGTVCRPSRVSTCHLGVLLQVAELRERLREAEADAGGKAGAEFEQSAVEGMEASLIRMSEIVRRKDAEVESLKRTVNAECTERVRLLALVTQQQALAGPLSAPPSKAPGSAPDAENWRGGLAANKHVGRKPGPGRR